MSYAVNPYALQLTPLDNMTMSSQFQLPFKLNQDAASLTMGWASGNVGELSSYQDGWMELPPLTQNGHRQRC